MVCNTCGALGHNKRTCERRVFVDEDRASTLLRSEPALQKIKQSLVEVDSGGSDSESLPCPPRRAFLHEDPSPAKTLADGQQPQYLPKIDVKGVWFPFPLLHCEFCLETFSGLSLATQLDHIHQCCFEGGLSPHISCRMVSSSAPPPISLPLATADTSSSCSPSTIASYQVSLLVVPPQNNRVDCINTRVPPLTTNASVSCQDYVSLPLHAATYISSSLSSLPPLLPPMDPLCLPSSIFTIISESTAPRCDMPFLSSSNYQNVSAVNRTASSLSSATDLVTVPSPSPAPSCPSPSTLSRDRETTVRTMEFNSSKQEPCGTSTDSERRRLWRKKRPEQDVAAGVDYVYAAGLEAEDKDRKATEGELLSGFQVPHSIFHLSIHADLPCYQLHCVMPCTATLLDLDLALRQWWMEPCACTVQGHASCFRILEKSYARYPSLVADVPCSSTPAAVLEVSSQRRSQQQCAPFPSSPALHPFRSSSLPVLSMRLDTHSLSPVDTSTSSSYSSLSFASLPSAATKNKTGKKRARGEKPQLRRKEQSAMHPHKNGGQRCKIESLPVAESVAHLQDEEKEVKMEESDDGIGDPAVNEEERKWEENDAERRKRLMKNMGGGDNSDRCLTNWEEKEVQAEEHSDEMDLDLLPVDEMKGVAVDGLFQPGLVFSYEYDIVSATRLVVTVLSRQPTLLLPFALARPSTVTLLCRNQMPLIPCSVCLTETVSAHAANSGGRKDKEQETGQQQHSLKRAGRDTTCGYDSDRDSDDECMREKGEETEKEEREETDRISTVRLADVVCRACVIERGHVQTNHFFCRQHAVAHGSMDQKQGRQEDKKSSISRLRFDKQQQQQQQQQLHKSFLSVINSPRIGMCRLSCPVDR